MIISAEQLNGQRFDFVICGGGTAGLTLAARLTEDPAINVLVIEAGHANIDDPNLLLPAVYASHFGNNAYAWDHKTTKQKSLNGRAAGMERGKGLGGSSGINFMAYTKPPARDIDDFERLGNPGWGYKDLKPYFHRFEGFTDPTDEHKKKLGVNTEDWDVGREGPVQLSYPATPSESDITVQQTYMNLGFKPAMKPLEGDPTGVAFYPNSYDPKLHKRSYATTAYYLPNKDRPNFQVIVGAHVNRVLTTRASDGAWTATGVEFHDGASGTVCQVDAQKEVIISAGTLKTPQLLELSGFGRPDVLARIGVPVKEPLPGVGENVQDHIFVGLSWEIKDDVPLETLDLLRDPALAAKHLDLHASGTGLHTTGVIGFTWAPAGAITSAATHAALCSQMTAATAALDDSAEPGLKRQFEIALERFAREGGSPGCEFIHFPGLLSGPNLPEPGKRYLSIIVALNHCFSRGTIHCASADPLQDPDIDARFYEYDFDLALHVEAVKFARTVADTAPLKDVLAREHNPGIEVQSDEQFREWIKLTMGTTWHTASSCAMLPRELCGVVDPALKVYGTRNLRVVDLSVVPLHFAAHTQGVVYAIAEKAADMIKGAQKERV